jgi:hypothetical protein
VTKTSESFISFNESQSTEVFGALKPLYSYMKDKAHFTFPEDENRKNDEFYRLITNQENMAPIIKTYNIIKKKIGSVSESVKDLLLSPESLASHIYNVYNVTKTKEGGEFDVDDVMKEQIKTFNSTMKEILSSTSGDKPEDEFQVGKEYTYKSKKNGDVKSLFLSKDRVVLSPGEDGDYLTTKDNKYGDKLPDDDTVSITYKNKNGKYITPSIGVSKSSLSKESRLYKYI